MKGLRSKGLWQRIKDVALTDVTVIARGGLDAGSLEKLEELLLTSDFGVSASLRLVDAVEKLARAGRIRTEDDFEQALAREIAAIMARGDDARALHYAPAGTPTVFVMVGVNGVGKTTTIGKLAHRLKREGRSPLLAAADTFRAGAIDQLRIWAERADVGFVGSQPGADPAAVAFDAIDAAYARGNDTVIVDTAGRLHTQNDLMTEIAKVQRVIARRLEGAPHETLLVLDATVGQNALAQTRTFSQALPLTGLVLAKLDSSAKGGVVVALQQEFELPVKLVGTGERMEQLETFDAERFAQAVVSD